MSQVLDLVAALLVLVGAVFCLSAAVGLVRFPDVITRLHAATKPQVLGLVLVLLAVIVAERSWTVTGVCLVVILLQIMTNPVAAHMVARTAYRTDVWDAEHAVVDELAEDLERAGYRHPGSPPPDPRGAP